MVIGVDTGGTFTDFVVVDSNGQIRIVKTPSTPSDPSAAILAGLDEIKTETGFELIHGTTVATNALLERKGAKTALITTAGSRDVLEIARQTRSRLYDLSPKPRNPIIPRELRLEVTERLDWQGNVVSPLDRDSVERALDSISDASVESLAVCLLFSFLNPDHELEVGRMARERGFQVSLSHQIAPEYREYERTSTVCANAFVAPVLSLYLDRLGSSLSDRGAARFAIMQSNGGTLRAEEAASNAVKTVLSGPAGGVIAARNVARAAGFDRIITFDMGGTSTDVALLNGEPETIRSGEVAGLPLLTPMLDIHTVGAGGGSIARLDSAGALRVGPESAGADPGPVAYGRGSSLTVTDANLMLGRLHSDVRLAGRVPLNLARVQDAFEPLASRMNLTAETAADGIITVVNAHMARAIRHISVERGHDPADYALVAFGGAGGLHACDLAESLQIKTILIPRFPGAFSALGLALADVVREYAITSPASATAEAADKVRAAIASLAERASNELTNEGIEAEDQLVEQFVEMRYVGQTYALRVPFGRRMEPSIRAFHKAHRSRYGHSDTTQPVEVVTVGVTAKGRVSRSLKNVNGVSRAAEPIAYLPVQVSGAWKECPVYGRADLPAGQQLMGPATVIQDDSTTFIKAGWTGTVDLSSNLILRAGQDGT